jgi:hypothetical protein
VRDGLASEGGGLLLRRPTVGQRPGPPRSNVLLDRLSLRWCERSDGFALCTGYLVCFFWIVRLAHWSSSRRVRGVMSVPTHQGHPPPERRCQRLHCSSQQMRPAQAAQPTLGARAGIVRERSRVAAPPRYSFGRFASISFRCIRCGDDALLLIGFAEFLGP